MASDIREVYEFGTFRLDVAERRLFGSDLPITIAPKLFDTLALLVRENGRLVTKESFMHEVWPETFVTDVTLAHNISALRKVLGHSEANPIIETVAKKGYRFVAAARLVTDRNSEPPIAVAVAPAIPPASSPEPARFRGARLALVVSVSVIALAGVYYAWARLRAAPSAAIHSLMVLPLDNQSLDPGQEHLADGLTDALTTELARIGSLRVISRTTATQYKAGGKPLEQIASELGIDAIVEGALERSGDRIRVTAQLIQLKPERHLWAERYDRPLTDFLVLESDIAQAVARAIQVSLTPVDRARMTPRHTPQPAAYDAYLRAKYFESGAAGPAAERSIENYKQAIAADPAFAVAYAGLARAYVFGIRMRPKLALAAADETAAKARALDAGAPEVLLASAIAKLYYAHDFKASEQQFRGAIEADPGSADAYFYYAQCLVAMGRFEEALTAARRAQRLDPMSPLIGHYIGRIYYFARQYDKAIEELQKALALNPTYAFTHMYFVTSYERLHDYDRALTHRQKYWAVLGRSADNVAALGDEARASGYKGALRFWVKEATAFAERAGYVTSTELTHVHAELGNVDEAIAWLERAVDDQVRDLIYVNVEPGFDPLRADARFASIARRIQPARREAVDATPAATRTPPGSPARRCRSSSIRARAQAGAACRRTDRPSRACPKACPATPSFAAADGPT